MTQESTMPASQSETPMHELQRLGQEFDASQSEALVTQADRDAAERYFSAANPADVFHGTELAQAFAQHRIAARREGIEEAARYIDDHLDIWGPRDFGAEIRALAEKQP